MNISARTRSEILVLVAVCGFLFVYGLSSFGLLGADEPRYAQVAHEMFDRGDWVTPTLGGEPWLEKPVLYYWEAIAAYKLFGVSDWSARLPGAFSAILLVAGIYIFLSRFRPGSQSDGALITAACAALIGFGRSASTDMPLAANFSLALIFWFAWYESGKKTWLIAAYFFLGLATLAKGPVAFVLAGAVIVLFALSKRELRLILESLSLPGFLIFCLVAVPWYVMVQLRNPEFFRIFVLEHNLARFGTNLYRHVQPFWFYIPVTLLGFLPWTVFVLAGLLETIRAWWAGGRSMLQSEDGYDVFLVIWLLTPIVFFSLSRSKLPGYILPAIPAATLLVADYLRRHTASEVENPKWLLGIHSLLAGGIVAPALLIPFLLHRQSPSRSAIVIAIAAGLLFALIVFFLVRSRYGLNVLRLATLVPVLITVAALIRIGAPTLDLLHSARTVAATLRGAGPEEVALLGVSRQTEYGLNFYLNADLHREGKPHNQLVASYDRGEIPSGGHVLVAKEGLQRRVADAAGSRKVAYRGEDAAQHLEFYSVAAAVQH